VFVSLRSGRPRPRTIARPPDRAGTARPGDPLPRARPEDVGMSSARLAVIAKVLKDQVVSRDTIRRCHGKSASSSTTWCARVSWTAGARAATGTSCIRLAFV